MSHFFGQQHLLHQQQQQQQQPRNYTFPPPQLQHPFHHDTNSKHMFAIPPPPPLSAIPPPPFDRDISPPRKRTRTSPEQLAVLEKSFSLNPSPNNRVREQLAHQLGMPERSIQIWFQNRRAKVKNQAKRSVQMQDSTLYMQQQYAASAAAAACQSAAFQQQQDSIDPNLYYYYYYYYFHQQQQHQHQQRQALSVVTDPSAFPPPPPAPSSSFSTPTSSYPPPINTSSMPDLTLSASTSSSSITSDNHHHHHHHQRRHHNRSSSASSSYTERTRAHSVGPYPYYRKSTPQEQRQSSLGPPPTASISNPISTTASAGTLSDTTTTATTPTNIMQSHPLLFNTSSDAAKLYNSSTILEEPYHIAPSSNSGKLRIMRSKKRCCTLIFHIAQSSAQQKYNLTAQTLQIGTWKRVCDLRCHMDLSTRTLIWCIGDEQQSFRIDIKLNLIQFIRMHTNSMTNTNKLEFFLSSPDQVKFFMTTTTDGNAWVQCHDFTQDKQASSENVHVLEGFSLLQAEFMEILMQAPDLQSLVIQEEEAAAGMLQDDAVASMYHHGSQNSSFLNNNSSQSLLLDDVSTTDDGMATNLLLLQGLHLP